MAIPDPPKAGSPFCALWTAGGWNPKTPKINNFFSAPAGGGLFKGPARRACPIVVCGQGVRPAVSYQPP